MMSTSIQLLTQAIYHEKLKEAFQGFYCGCGTQLQTKDEYKSHLSQKHQGKFIEGSSHFISIYSEIVLPCRCWTPDQIGKPRPSFCQAKVPPKIKEFGKDLSSSTNEKELNKKRPNTRKVERYKKIQADRKGESLQQRHLEKIPSLKEQIPKEKTLIWNGFVLIPNNTNRDSSNFFCGACKLSFLTPDQFIPHCFDQCQQLEHPNSSHSIALPENQMEFTEVEPQSFESSENSNENNRIRHDIKKKVKKPRKPRRRRLSENQIPQNLRSLYRLFINKPIKGQSFRNDEKFFCGCGQQFSVKVQSHLIWRHLGQKHQEILPANSSHIVVRMQYRPSMMLRIAGADDEQLGWSCPCKPDVSMTCKAFVNHVQYIHKGISVFYDSGLFYR